MNKTPPLFESKDNEFIAWYPLGLTDAAAEAVWQPKLCGYYVHIPFCTAICDYCGFAISQAKDSNIPRYLDAIHREIEIYAQSSLLSNYRFKCGHFGGGTPSVIEGRELVSIKRAIDDYFDVCSDAEITVEVNPISFDKAKAVAYQQAGVNRISFGVQSFNDRTLKTIGRPHRSEDTENTLRIIKGSGIDNFSIDLIYGVPGQTLDDLTEDLRKGVETGATHISCFRLEIIPFTILKFRESVGDIPSRLSRELLNEMDDLVSEYLIAAGYLHYGAFNFAKPGFESIHNRIAFVAPQGEYVGFGNSSYSFINNHVFSNYSEITLYEEAVFNGHLPIAKAKKVSPYEAMSRFFVLGLKFFKVSRTTFTQEFGLPPEALFADTLRLLIDNGYIKDDGDNYELTSLGRHYVNNVCKAFYVGESIGQRQHTDFIPTITPKQINFYAKRMNMSI